MVWLSTIDVVNAYSTLCAGIYLVVTCTTFAFDEGTTLDGGTVLCGVVECAVEEREKRNGNVQVSLVSVILVCIYMMVSLR